MLQSWLDRCLINSTVFFYYRAWLLSIMDCKPPDKMLKKQVLRNMLTDQVVVDTLHAKQTLKVGQICNY